MRRGALWRAGEPAVVGRSEAGEDREEVIDLLASGAEDARMLRVAFAGTFSASLAPPVRAHLEMPCDVILADEVGIVSRLSDVDVLVTLAFTRQMGAAAGRLKLVQVPGAV